MTILLAAIQIKTWFACDRSQSQCEVSETRLTGLQQCHLGEVTFHDCRVPRENLLGTSADTAKILTLTWIANKPIIDLCAVHFAQKAFESVRTFAADHKQFGRSIAGFVIQECLADIETAIVASRLLCYNALAAMDRDKRANSFSAMPRRLTAQACDRAISLAMAEHGAIGLSKSAA